MRPGGRLSGFLAVRHGAVVRQVTGALLGGVTLAATGRMRLASDVRKLAAREDRFKSAFRRTSFYLRRGWPGLNLSRDPMFVFCSGMADPDLAVLRDFLLARPDSATRRCDLAYVSASRFLSAAGGPAHETERRVFLADAQAVLSGLPAGPRPPGPPPAPVRPPVFDRAAAGRALADFAATMQRHGLPWFVISGTFLGAVRDGGFLPHDDDIDVGVMASEVPVAALEAALRADPRLHVAEMEWLTVLPPPGGGAPARFPVFLKVAHVNGIQIDIFLHHADGGTLWHASRLFRWDNAAFGLSTHDLDGMAVLGPAEADRYLTENYGDWRTPRPLFNSASDTPNLRLIANPLSVAIHLRRLHLALAAGDPAAPTLLGMLAQSGMVGPDGQFRADLFAC
jgi:hypothetical protein